MIQTFPIVEEYEFGACQAVICDVNFWLCHNPQMAVPEFLEDHFLLLEFLDFGVKVLLAPFDQFGEEEGGFKPVDPENLDRLRSVAGAALGGVETTFNIAYVYIPRG